MLNLRESEKTCIFCNERFTLDSAAWLIEKRPLQEKTAETKDGAENDLSARAKDAFWDALNRFSRPDYKGTSFYRTMSGNLDITGRLEAERVCFVLPEDFRAPARPTEKSINTYTTSDNREIPIFQQPGRDGRGPYLRFTDEFAEEMQSWAPFQRDLNREFIEEECIRPVCPSCMSYIPREQFDDSQQDAYVIRLAYIGQVESGKTTLNWTNLMCDAFEQNGWTSSSKKVFSSTHYLAENFYEDLYKYGKIPERTSKFKYTPPLLVRIHRNRRTLLLALVDIAGEMIQQLRVDNAGDGADLQSFAYRKMLKQMDGFLLMLDSEKEFPPLFGIVNSRDNQSEGKKDEGDGRKSNTPAPPGPETLYELLKGCIDTGIEEFKKKPAALLLTKCDTLFNSQGNTLLGRKYKDLFSAFAPVEEIFWQQVDESPKERMKYNADYHECIQIPFQALVEERFPLLWNSLQNTFACVGVFPESSLGTGTDKLPASGIKKTDIQPFHSADPIFWLMDVIPAPN